MISAADLTPSTPAYIRGFSGHRDARVLHLGGSPENCVRRRELLNEASPCLVVTAVGAEEAIPAAGELLGAVGRERLVALVLDAPPSFASEACLVQAVVGHALGEPPQADTKVVQACAEDGVQQSDPDRLVGAKRVERGLG